MATIASRPLSEQYDRAVAVAPEAAVALYSLGDPAILERATAELAALLGDWGFLGADRDALDIGCGIGRIEQALAPCLRTSSASICRRR